jgi:large conductance mechanosensitive channel
MRHLFKWLSVQALPKEDLILSGGPQDDSLLIGNKGFKQFLSKDRLLTRSNPIDLGIVAVTGIGIVVLLGGSFAALLTAIVRDLLTPLINAVVGKPDFAILTFTINGNRFLIGDLLSALISFVLLTFTVYFFGLVPLSALLGRSRRSETSLDPTTKQCPECLSIIASRARRCAFCTSEVPPGCTPD